MLVITLLLLDPSTKVFSIDLIKYLFVYRDYVRTYNTLYNLLYFLREYKVEICDKHFNEEVVFITHEYVEIFI